MHRDFALAARRLEERGRAQDERARTRAARAAAARKRAEDAERRAEEEASARRRAELEAEEAERVRRDELREAQGGVLWSASLRAAPLDPSAAAARGIRRAEDKVSLPPSVGRLLMDAGSMRNGAAFFELAAASGARTHASALDYSAPEGTVLLPRAVARCLWGDAETPGEGRTSGGGRPGAGVARDAGPDAAAGPESDPGDGDDAASGPRDGPGPSPSPSPPPARWPDDPRLFVAYRVLPAGRRARLQPARADFQELAGEGIREALEVALGRRATLTEGDRVYVAPAPGAAEQALLVRSTDPPGAVSILDVDLEADLDPSLESEARAREAEERARLEREAAERAAEEARREAAALRAEGEAREAARREAVLELEVRASSIRARALRALEALDAGGGGRGVGAGASLERPSDAGPAAAPARGDPTPSPPGPAPRSVSVALRLPGGAQARRSFAATAPLAALFALADAAPGGAEAAASGGYRIVSRFPRRVLERPEHDGPSLAEAGLGSTAEALFVEALQSATRPGDS